jgi:glycosyltransferase involved in cell wall biosynthesis
MVPKKGHAVLFEAVKLLNETGTPVVLACAGTGPLEAELRAKAPPGVTFLGNLSHDAVRDEMLHSDIVVLASRIAADGDRDGIPVALIEAMALGVPVVATRVSGIPELLERGVQPGEPTGLAHAIRQAASLAEEARLIQARSARRCVGAEHDIGRAASLLST